MSSRAWHLGWQSAGHWNLGSCCTRDGGALLRRLSSVGTPPPPGPLTPPPKLGRTSPGRMVVGVALALGTAAGAGWYWYGRDPKRGSVVDALRLGPLEELEDVARNARTTRALDAALVKYGITTLKLREEVVAEVNDQARTLWLGRPSGVERVDLNQLASNAPIEDYLTACQIGQDGLLFGVFDGHSGRECAAAVSANLTGYVARAFQDRPFAAAPAGMTRKQWVMERLQAAFVALDDDITEARLPPTMGPEAGIEEELGLALARVRQAMAGSCALLAYIEGRHLYIACTGDSRAVLGKRVGPNSFATLELSADQTLHNPDELDRMQEEHPGELETMAVRGRVLGGLMPTRAFGDARYKWPGEVQDVILPAVASRKRRLANYLTPPYVTAKPEVTHYYLAPEAEGFLVLATDGLYDALSSEAVVATVARHGAGHPAAPFARGDNSATSLLVEAMRAGSEENVRKSLSIPAPWSRRYRDDMTVEVIYFAPLPEEGAAARGGTNTLPQADPRLGGPKPSHLPHVLDILGRHRQQQQQPGSP